MKKRLLIYKWGSLSEPGFIRTVKKLGYDFVEFACEIKNYHADAAFAQAFIGKIHAEKVEVVFSYDYFPMIAMICQMNHIPYISWIYDCPLYTLESKTISYDCNYIFCFDLEYAKRLAAAGASHCYHYPLAADEEMLEAAMQAQGECVCEKSASAQETDSFCRSENRTMKGSFACDISFVGNLYNEKKNRLRYAVLMPQTAAFVEELVQKQLSVYGENFIKESLTPEAVIEIVEKCELKLGAECRQDGLQMAADAIGMEVSAREREQVLSTLSGHHTVRLYTSSELPTSLQTGNIEKMGYANYRREVPLIFRDSKINLNITSKTIESGIPQRIFDVLACGGFCLSNYQPEVAEYFVDGEELVMYTSIEDLVAKADYYLSHEEERAQIAKKGYRKVMTEFPLEKKVQEMLTRWPRN